MSSAPRIGLAALAVFAIGGAHAGLNPTYPVGTTAGTWEVDRYAPFAFGNAGTLLGRSDVLDLGISSADSLANRPPFFSSTFYNTQGRGFQISQTNYAVVYGSVYLPSAWTNSTGTTDYRRSDLWGVISPATGGDVCPGSACNLFPILDFTNADPNYASTNNAATGRYRVFDTSIGFVNLATPVAYNQWNDLCTVWTGTDIRHFVNGALVYTQTDISQDDTGFGPLNKLTRMMVQAYNFGSSYDVNWSGLGAGTVTSATVAGSGQTSSPGASFAQTLSVTVLDAGGAPIPCVPVTFTAPGSGASATLSAASMITDRAGVATITATANATLGTYSIGLRIPGLSAPPPLVLTNTLHAGPVPTWLLPGLLVLGGMLAALAVRAIKVRR